MCIALSSEAVATYRSSGDIEISFMPVLWARSVRTCDRE